MSRFITIFANYFNRSTIWVSLRGFREGGCTDLRGEDSNSDRWFHRGNVHSLGCWYVSMSHKMCKLPRQNHHHTLTRPHTPPHSHTLVHSHIQTHKHTHTHIHTHTHTSRWHVSTYHNALHSDAPLLRSGLLLDSGGLSWVLQNSPDLSWVRLASPGLSWLLLGFPGLSWTCLGSPNE